MSAEPVPFTDINLSNTLEVVEPGFCSKCEELPDYCDCPSNMSGTEGAALLDEIRAFLRRFVAFPSEDALTATVLWVALTHMVKHFYVAPRIAFLSPEPGSGKTRVLEVLALLTSNKLFVFAASSAAIFRMLANEQLTVLFDEVDAIFTKHGKDDANEDLRALLNVGYKRGATIPRCVGPRHEVQQFNVFAAVAMAGLGDLPQTLMDRSVIVRMRRRAPREYVEPFRDREQEAPGHTLRDRLAKWAETVGEQAGAEWPNLPAGIVDRPAEIWEPLISVADAAGGHWPETARTACVEMCKIAVDRNVSLGIRLLDDLRTIFGDSRALHTETIIERLCGQKPYGVDDEGKQLILDEAPWSDLYGKPLDVRGLSRRLRAYGITSMKVNINGNRLQGYRREHLWDAWARYLPPSPSAGAEPLEPEELPALESFFKVPDAAEVPDANGTSETSGWALNGPVPEVPAVREGRAACCAICGRALDRALFESGEMTHPDCDPTMAVA